MQNLLIIQTIKRLRVKTFDNTQKYAETLEKAQEKRVIEQYGVEVLTNDDAQWIIEDAKDFVLKIEEVLA